MCRSKALLAQLLPSLATMPIFFHHIRSWTVGEGQERRGGGNATWEVVSVSKSKLLGDILQHNHPLCLCSSAHMAHIQPVTLNHRYFLTYINKNKPNFRCSMWGKTLSAFPVKRPEAALKITGFVRSSLLKRRYKEVCEDLTNSTNTCVAYGAFRKKPRTAESFVHKQSRHSFSSLS